MLSHSTTSIFDLISEKFNGDSMSVHIMHPKRGFSNDLSEYSHLQLFHKDLQDMCARLPFMPRKAGFWATPPLPEDCPIALPRVIFMTRNPSDEAKTYPVGFDGQYLTDLT